MAKLPSLGFHFCWPNRGHHTLLVGLFFLKKYLELRSKKWFFLSATAFGFAVSTKLFAITVIPFAILAFLGWGRKVALKRALWLSAQLCAWAVLVFTIFYFFSIGHSFLFLKVYPPASLFDRPEWHVFFHFISEHFVAERTARVHTRDFFHFIGTNPWLAILSGVSALLLIRNWATALLVVVLVLLFAFANLYEPRLFMFHFFLLFFGCAFAADLFTKVKERQASMLDKLCLFFFVLGALATFAGGRTRAYDTVRRV